jgi:hypothetical protein
MEHFEDHRIVRIMCGVDFIFPDADNHHMLGYQGIIRQKKAGLMSCFFPKGMNHYRS